MFSSLPSAGLRSLATAVTFALVAALALAISPSVADAQEAEVGPFNCAVDASGRISWSDHDVAKYWVYRSIDGVSFNWIGRTLGEVSFLDEAAPPGSTYQVHYAGIPRVDCTNAIDGEDGQDGQDGSSVIVIDNGEDSVRIEDGAVISDEFTCAVIGDTIYWTDDAASKYWVYRSVDGGASFNWIGRTLGETNFVDADAPEGALYQVHYAGLARTDCTNFTMPDFDFDFDFDWDYPLG